MIGGDAIKKIRTQLGLKQRELAKGMGKQTSSFISDIESGKSDVTSSKLEEMAKAFSAVTGKNIQLIIRFEDQSDLKLSSFSIRRIEELEEELSKLTDQKVKLTINIERDEEN